VTDYKPNIAALLQNLIAITAACCAVATALPAQTTVFFLRGPHMPGGLLPNGPTSCWSWAASAAPGAVHTGPRCAREVKKKAKSAHFKIRT